MKRQDRSFSGPAPAASRPETPETQIQCGVFKDNTSAVYL